jgi:hypothetical protein
VAKADRKAIKNKFAVCVIWGMWRVSVRFSSQRTSFCGIVIRAASAVLALYFVFFSEHKFMRYARACGCSLGECGAFCSIRVFRASL